MKYLNLVLFLLFTFHLSAQEKGRLTLDQNARSLLEPIMSDLPMDTEIALAVIKDGKTQYIGVKNAKDGMVAIDNKSSAFEIGSITKVFTSGLLAHAIVSNELTIETQVSDILGYPLKDSFQLNLLQLSNHTGGLSRIAGNGLMLAAINIDNPYQQYSKELLEEYLVKHLEKGEQNKRSEYSNLGAGLLAHCLVVHHESTYEKLLKEKILEPLQMHNSTTKRENLTVELVTGLKVDGTIAPNWDFNAMEGAGALYSSVEDLQKFVQKVIDGSEPWINLQLEKTFEINDQMDIGMAWHILKNGSKKVYWHNGGTGGYSSNMIVDKEGKQAVILLSNVTIYHAKSGDVQNLVTQFF